MKREVKFKGKLGGDDECFCWFVTAEEFERATGNKPETYDRYGPVTYLLYPNQVLGDSDASRSKEKKLYTFTIITTDEKDG
jgi:hypothetical protein